MEPLEALRKVHQRHRLTRAAALQRGYVIATYRLRPKPGLDLEMAAIHIAKMVADRTLRDYPHLSHSQRIELSAQLITGDFDSNSGMAQIAFPGHLFGPREGLAQLLLMMLSGAEYQYAEGFWLEDFELPPTFASDRGIRGPRFGVKRVRELFGVEGRALLGILALPRFGTSLPDLAALMRRCLDHGADFVADDLLMSDPAGDLSFRKRVEALASEASRSGKAYVANVSGPPTLAFENALLAKEHDARAIIVNAFTMGFDTVRELAESDEIDLPIITTNMGVGTLTRPGMVTDLPKNTGVSEAVIATLSRLAGCDAVHTGTSESECYAQQAFGPATTALRDDNLPYPTSFVVAEGDLDILSAYKNIVSFGPDTIIEAGSGLLGYPGGPEQGATAFLTIVSTIDGTEPPDQAERKLRELYHKDKNIAAGLDACDYQPKQVRQR